MQRRQAGQFFDGVSLFQLTGCSLTDTGQKPLTGVDYGRYLLLQNDTSRPLRLLKDHLIHRGFQER